MNEHSKDVRCCSCHGKIKFIFLRHCVMYYLLCIIQYMGNEISKLLKLIPVLVYIYIYMLVYFIICNKMQVLLLILQHDTSVLVASIMPVFKYIVNIHVLTTIHSYTVYINSCTFLKISNIGFCFPTSNCPFANIII